MLSYHLFWTSDLWTHQPGSHRRKVTKDVSIFLLRCSPQFLSREGFSHPLSLSTVKSNFQNLVYPRIHRSPLVRRDFLNRVTAPRFELTSQRQKVSRLPTEPPGRPAITLAICVTIHPISSEAFLMALKSGDKRLRGVSRSKILVLVCMSCITYVGSAKIRSMTLTDGAVRVWACFPWQMPFS